MLMEDLKYVLQVMDSWLYIYTTIQKLPFVVFWRFIGITYLVICQIMR